MAKLSPMELSERRTHRPAFKVGVAMEAVSGCKTIQEIASDHANFAQVTPRLLQLDVIPLSAHGRLTVFVSRRGKPVRKVRTIPMTQISEPLSRTASVT